MKNKFWIAGFATLALVACKTPLAVTNVQTQKNISIAANLPEDAAMNGVIAPYKKSLESQMNAKISHTNVDLNKQGDNSNLGNLLADYTYDGAVDWAKKNNIPQIDAAVINIGGIRSTIGKGDILLKHIFEVMPFENELVIVKMKGSDVNSLFDYYLETQKNNPVSHLLVETEQGKISRALINNTNVDPSKTYYIATSDYLALGGDNMKFFNKGEIITTGVKLRDLYVEKFRQTPEVTAPNDVRLIFKGKPNRNNE
ncbi:5'-nucleotidase C-terminal domain-containing protein [uncultured Chryseobacterium sp.]|uniref:5'-nucleotidase C-terminal domain-containing protein n=1 Tax=uncultured Chryseobacterium sp. TaxID=259322 RepID=UPI00262385B0|nr:5'-nucleotidase C-terminal domain-containing protein [uncultured Chryseobacterium sp.]